MSTFIFETPIVREGPAGGHRLFHFYKLNVGISIIKDAGVYIYKLDIYRMKI
jgi:hypothetical protein